MDTDTELKAAATIRASVPMTAAAAPPIEPHGVTKVWIDTNASLEQVSETVAAEVTVASDGKSGLHRYGSATLGAPLAIG
jgi:hypothetical protein